LVHTPNATLTAVAAGSSLERASAFATKFTAMQEGVTPGLPPVEALENYAKLAARDDIDIVYVGTVNTNHFETSMMLIQAGKNVLIEKPVGVNAKEAQLLQTAASEKKVFMMEGMWTRCFPSIAKVKSLIENGDIGKVVAVHADFGFRCDDPVTSRMFDINLAGGGLLDIGIYPLAFATLAYGGSMPTTIKAVCTKHATTGVDTSGGITMVFDNTKVESDEAGGSQPGIALITYNLRGFTPEEVTIVGTEGRVLVKGPAHCATQVCLTKPIAREGVSEELFDFTLPNVNQQFLNFPRSEGLVHEVQHVQECLAQNLLESPLYTHQEMLNIAAIMQETRNQFGIVYPADSAN
jgi:dihydrodiol dehydrogenase / D-xylose 1-dehydrogenase (NADP)